jgi:hypothetical protein
MKWKKKKLCSLFVIFADACQCFSITWLSFSWVGENVEAFFCMLTRNRRLKNSPMLLCDILALFSTALFRHANAQEVNVCVCVCVIRHNNSKIKKKLYFFSTKIFFRKSSNHAEWMEKYWILLYVCAVDESSFSLYHLLTLSHLLWRNFSSAFSSFLKRNWWCWWIDTGEWAAERKTYTISILNEHKMLNFVFDDKTRSSLHP